MSITFKMVSLSTTLTLTALLSACGQDDTATQVAVGQIAKQTNQTTEQTTEQTTATDTDAHGEGHIHVNEKEHDPKAHSKRDMVNPDYVIATDPSNIPFEFTNEDGTINGLDTEIINAIAEDQNFTYNFKPRKWQGIFKEIEENKSDLISGIVVETDARRKKYDFTNPIFIKKRYAYLADSTAKQHNVSKFADICSLKVAVKDETDKSALYYSVCGQANPNLVPVSSNYTAFRHLVSGKVEVAIGDDILYNYLIKENKVNNIVTVADPDDKEIILAWPTQKGNTEFLTKFNAGLANIKQNGTYDKLVHKWLGDDFKIHN